jgi:hypothetical protein
MAETGGSRDSNCGLRLESRLPPIFAERLWRNEAVFGTAVAGVVGL